MIDPIQKLDKVKIKGDDISKHLYLIPNWNICVWHFPRTVVSHGSQEQVRKDDPMVWWHASCNINTSTIRKMGCTTVISGARLKRAWGERRVEGSYGDGDAGLSPPAFGDSLETTLVSVRNSPPNILEALERMRKKSSKKCKTNSNRQLKKGLFSEPSFFF